MQKYVTKIGHCLLTWTCRCGLMSIIPRNTISLLSLKKALVTKWSSWKYPLLCLWMKYLSFIYQPHVVDFCWGPSDYPSGKAQLWCWDVGYEAESRQAPVCHLTFLFQSPEKPNPFSPQVSAAEPCKEAMQDVLRGKRLQIRRKGRRDARFQTAVAAFWWIEIGE